MAQEKTACAPRSHIGSLEILTKGTDRIHAMTYTLLVTLIICLFAPIQGFADNSSVDDLSQRLGICDTAVAGRDVTDPEPLPEDHELWTMPNVIITPHSASESDLSERNTIILARENLATTYRRAVAKSR